MLHMTHDTNIISLLSVDSTVSVSFLTLSFSVRVSYGGWDIRGGCFKFRSFRDSFPFRGFSVAWQNQKENPSISLFFALADRFSKFDILERIVIYRKTEDIEYYVMPRPPYLHLSVFIHSVFTWDFADHLLAILQRVLEHAVYVRYIEDVEDLEDSSS